MWNKRCGCCYPSCGVGKRIPKKSYHKSSRKQNLSNSENDISQSERWHEDDDALLVVDDAPEPQRMDDEDQERNIQKECCSLRHHYSNARKAAAEKKIRNYPPGHSGHLRPIRKRR